MLGKSANHPVHTIHLNLFKTRIYLYTVGTIYFYRYIIYIYEHSICTPVSMVDYDVCMCVRAREYVNGCARVICAERSKSKD
jgi:hypothetical protein